MDAYCFGHSNDGCGCCDCSCRNRSRCFVFCKPFACLFFVFPAMPENMWGGLVGLLCGTHALTSTSCLYQGGNCFIDLLGLPCLRATRADELHSDTSWRARVRDYLESSANVNRAPESDARPHTYTQPPRGESGRDARRRTAEEIVFEGQRYKVLRVGRAKVLNIGRAIDSRDRCAANTLEDYRSRTCWICQSEHDSWDLWISCRHVFCSTCSNQMLLRNMPCPLCRVASSTVLRTTRPPEGAESGSSSSGESSPHSELSPLRVSRSLR